MNIVGIAGIIICFLVLADLTDRIPVEEPEFEKVVYLDGKIVAFYTDGMAFFYFNMMGYKCIAFDWGVPVWWMPRFEKDISEEWHRLRIGWIVFQIGLARYIEGGERNGINI